MKKNTPQRKQVVKYHSVISGKEYVFGKNTIHYWACCDCNLVHAVLIHQLGGDMVGVTMWRDEYHTELSRKAVVRGKKNDKKR